MATINKTIATSGGDYTSRSLAEASIPGSGADDYIFTVNEAFTDTTVVTCSFGTSNTMEVTVAAAYRCNGAVTGAHAELKYTTNDANNLITDSVAANVTWRHDRLIRQTTSDTSADVVDTTKSSGTLTLDRCTIIDDNAAGRALRIVASGNITVMGCFFVDRNNVASANDIIFWRTAGTSKFYRNTVFIANQTRVGGVRANLTNTSVDARQNLVIKAAGATLTNGCYYADAGGAFNASSDANGATDTTSPGTHTNNSLTPGNVLTTLTSGSENLHYPSRTAMLALTAGSTVSATTGTVDIDGETIGAWYPGADYVYGIPTLSSVSPDNGPAAGGTAVTLTGTNFTDVTGVTFGGDAATGVSVVNDTSITCTTPAHAAGAVSVLATNADGSNTANSAYTYNAVAVLTGVGSAVRLRFSDLGFGRR